MRDHFFVFVLFFFVVVGYMLYVILCAQSQMGRQITSPARMCTHILLKRCWVAFAFCFYVLCVFDAACIWDMWEWPWSLKNRKTLSLSHCLSLTLAASSWNVIRVVHESERTICLTQILELTMVAIVQKKWLDRQMVFPNFQWNVKIILFF